MKLGQDRSGGVGQMAGAHVSLVGFTPDATSAAKRTLEQDQAEAEQLHRDLLIGVTHFFRDPDVWEALALQVLPAIAARGDPSAALRLWVPGCASGEEAYSLAILVREHLAQRDASRFRFAPVRAVAAGWAAPTARTDCRARKIFAKW